MRRVATLATLAMRPRDVDFVWGKSDDAGDCEKVKNEVVASKRRSCWGIPYFPPRSSSSSSSSSSQTYPSYLVWHDLVLILSMLFVLHPNSRWG